MGEIVLAAKCTLVPTMLISEQEGPVTATHQPAIDGHAEIARRPKALGAEKIVICDTHWVINEGFHISAKCEVVSPYFPSSGVGQTNVIFPVQ